MTFRQNELSPVIAPKELAAMYPISKSTVNFIHESRIAIENILTRNDQRLLVVVGPCSIHDTKAAYEYAERLAKLQLEVSDNLLIVMRVYFDKPRTSVGWRGLISDPDLNGEFQPNKGLELACSLLQKITELNLAVGTEFLDIMNSHYLKSFISWGAIGARTTESQIHRELASGLPCPIGFKNGTNGNINIALDAIKAAQQKHVVYAPNEQGLLCTYQTSGNKASHIILRGGHQHTNYQRNHVAATDESLKNSKLPNNIMIDCSHGNSAKQHNKQEDVIADVIKQIEQGNQSIIGLMAESFLEQGKQNLDRPEPLRYGQSITDACLDWNTTETLIYKLAQTMRHYRID